MNKLNPFVKPTAQSLKDEGARILSVFTKTKDDLQKLNIRHNDYLTQVDAEIDRLRIERSMVVTSMQDNSKIVSKIEEFLK